MDNGKSVSESYTTRRVKKKESKRGKVGGSSGGHGNPGTQLHQLPKERVKKK
jgi:hypothetical protein